MTTWAVAVCCLHFFPQEQVVESLIKQLGSANPEEREVAAKALIQRGREVRARLESATKEKDSEIAGRAGDILAAIDRQVDSISDVLERTRIRNADSYHQLLKQATDAVRGSCVGKEWTDVAKSFERQKIGPADPNHHQWGTTYRCVVKKGAIKAGGHPLDLIIELDTTLVTSKTEPTRQVIQRAKAGLSMAPKVPIEELARAKPFAEGTLLDRFLNEVRAEGSPYPILQELRVEYDRIHERREEIVLSGFHLMAEFVTKDGRAGKRVFFTVESGLDPPQTRDGAVPAERFVPKDTLGEFRSRGGSEWKSTASGPNKSFWEIQRLDPAPRQASAPMEKPPVARSPADLKALAADTTSLQLQGKDLSDADLKALDRFRGLQKLTVRDCENLGDAGLVHLQSLPELTTLTLYDARTASDGSVKLLAVFPKLKDLTLLSCQHLTSTSYEALGKMKGLTRLHLWWCDGITDADLKKLSQLADLEELRLWGSRNLTDEGLEHLSKLSKLRRLTFSHTKSVTPVGLAHLAALKHLEEIQIGYASVDDRGLESLSRLITLERLVLRGLDVTDQGLGSLKTLSNLVELYLEGCGKVTEDGMKTLQYTLPGKYKLR
jgi:hypothetical protein